MMDKSVGDVVLLHLQWTFLHFSTDGFKMDYETRIEEGIEKAQEGKTEEARVIFASLAEDPDAVSVHIDVRGSILLTHDETHRCMFCTGILPNGKSPV